MFGESCGDDRTVLNQITSFKYTQNLNMLEIYKGG